MIERIITPTNRDRIENFLNRSLLLLYYYIIILYRVLYCTVPYPISTVQYCTVPYRYGTVQYRTKKYLYRPICFLDFVGGELQQYGAVN